MKAKIADLWIKALRSGDYKQGRGQLEDNKGRFCCLGVLCDLAIKDGVKINREIGHYNNLFTYDTNTGSLPDKVMKWSGLKTSDGTYKYYSDTIRALWRHNDEGRMSFEEIADIIEENRTRL